MAHHTQHLEAEHGAEVANKTPHHGTRGRTAKLTADLVVAGPFSPPTAARLATVPRRLCRVVQSTGTSLGRALCCNRYVQIIRLIVLARILKKFAAVP